MRNRWWVVAPGLAAAAVVLAACGSSSSGTNQPTSSPTTSAAAQANAAAETVTIKTMSTSRGTVLTTAGGRTLYWFSNDTPSKSKCDGSCATYWPPVIGTAAVAAGASLPHGFGTIIRSDGQTQITYDGHPLYTYTGDTAPGQIRGNGLNASGGMWWAVTPSGADLRASSSSRHGSSHSSQPSPAPSSSSSGSGSGGGW
jgi:predicted lipoprotein with Yx(FWY)xxD motif